MGSAVADSAQWLSVKEETIFLHDGLIRVTDLAELPSEIGVSEPGDVEQEILTFETKNLKELAERLRAVCGNQSNAYARLLEYRLNALRGLWNAQRQLALEEQHERENSTDEETLALLKRQGLLQQPEQAPFTSRMGLLLVFPLIQSQSKTDPSLCNITAEVLLSCLRDCQPLSLTKEPTDCLNGLETLLCSWLEEPSASGQQIPQKQKKNAAAALVALACARGSLKTLIHTVHLLQKQTDLGSLSVADVLHRLLLLEGGPGSPSCLLGGKHMVSWGFEDMLPAPESNSSSGTENKDVDLGRCLATDGLYLYTSNSSGKGISKLGSGLHGTLRGFVYNRNEELETGWIVFGNGRLLHRPASFDSKPHYLFQVIDHYNLQVCQIVSMPANHFPVGSPMTTVQLCSDGTYIYWVWSPASLNEKTPKGHSVFMDIFELIVKNGICVANPLQERIILMRKEGESVKSINEMLLSRLSRYRASPSATLAALTGSTISNTLKEDQTAATTSCGLTLKMLRKTPMYTCGTYLVMLIPPPGGSGSSATRSLFGGTSGLSSLKILASSLVFNISDGQFTSRADLIDAAGSSLGRGALVPGLGACYDALNNMIWTCSNDYIDQWCNPGNQAFHHVCQRLGVSHVITEPRGETMPTNEVINQLLHHVGAMCIHQLNLLAASNHLPITSFLGKQHPIEAHHLSSICDIMEKAMVNEDTSIIRCILVVFQVVFKFFFNPQMEKNREIVRKSGLLLWQLLMAPLTQIGSEIQKEVCLAISSGLNTLYPGEVEINNLLKLVLTEGERNMGLSQLRDVILTSLAEQLQNNRFGSEEDDHYRLNDELLYYILKIVVRESCILITKCQTVSKEDFQKLLSTVPVASPCLRYLMAVQNHLLSNTVLIKPDEHDDSDNSLQGETLKVQDLQTSILALATKILNGCDEVLETLQQVTTALLNSDIADREQRLKGLEQITKATMLGHLLPVLLTSLMHPNLQTLLMADALMPQLVQLVLYTSQTALLLKTQSPLFSYLGEAANETLDPKDKSPEDCFRLLEEREEPGFLTGLKIPAPWAAGKTVETVHPVRDNYKFKETVHIPGARCLYLRFDSRCSSQYDYDKYNCASFQVEGDTVTFSFEMRSGREHNTPDKAMWGFACTVRAQESSEDVSGGLPFLADLALGLSVLACSMLQILYNGPEITKEEEACQDLLRSKLLQRCQWQVEANGAISPALTPSPSPLPLTIEEDTEFTYPSDVLVPPTGNYFDLPRIRLPPGIMGKLREISGRARPQFRPSIKEVIQPDVMEEMVVSCVIKHLNLVDALQSLINFQYREEHLEEYDLLCKIMGETFKKLNAMERQLQNKTKELELLCSLKEVPFDGGDLENVVLSLRDKFFQEMNLLVQKPTHPLAKTKALVKSLMNRADLLLHVTISAQSGITRSISGTPAETPASKSASESKVISHTVRQPVFLRSMSAPSDLEMIGNEDSEFRANQRRRHGSTYRSISFTLLQSLAIEDCRDKPTYSVLLGQLFAFIGTNPDQAVSSSSFLLAAQTRWRRGNTRKQALVHMRELLTAAVRVGGVTHLVGPVTMVLQRGPRIEELTCGGMVEQVQEAFGETMTSVVSLCARYPIACANSIGLLCTIPFTRSEEKCLVCSGLVQLMDRLCSLSSQRECTSTEKQTKKQKVATMAWAAFQVLANRCVEWEKEEGGSTDAVRSGLARQVSSLLTNHLARATECCGNQAAGNDALQDVLSLLNDLSRSQIGKAILSQPACVSKLLSLLLDQRPSPKLVLIILQLCRAALPLMSVEDCGNVELPPWSYSVPSLDSEQDDPGDPASKIASLLLAKLADYVVPGCQTVLSPSSAELDTTLTKASPKNSIKTDKDAGEESEAVDGKLSIFIHKREDQSSHEVLQPLLSSSEGRPFRLGTGANMEKVVKMDRDMTKSGCCEVVTEEAVAALRKATKWAQSGLIVSIGPPIESVSQEAASGLTTGDKKKTAQTSICRERNSELARTDPVRPFISGHVANSMAAEVIALLHSLLMAPESNTAQIWTTTAEKLLRCEAALARLYCRMALLNIFAPKSPHTFTRLFHIPAIRDITLEHLQLLSNQFLAPPLPDGTIASDSILLAQSLQHCIQAQNCSPTDLFYQGNAQPIREWLTVAITRALHQGEESLLDLTKQICCFLQNAPEQFPSEEFPVSESKVNMDVNFPGATFVVVSCKENQSGLRKDSSLYKAPWARVLVYGLGHKVKKNGQLNLIEAVCYPRDASPTNTGLTPPPTTNQYPSIVIPTDKVHIKLGVSPPPGAVIVLHSLPLEFHLAMAFAEQLLTWKLGESDERSEDELDTIPPSILLQVVELFGSLLWTTDLAANVKEPTFHLLAELLRKVHHIEQKKNPSGLSSSIALQLNPCLAMLMALQTELRKLYDEETQNWVTGNACGGTGVGVADMGRFSTYFHALMEVCLAVAEVTLPINMSTAVSVMSSNAPNLSDSSSSSSSSPGQTPQSPSLLSKRKKVKMKREKTSSGKRSSLRGGDSDTGILHIGGSKPEDMLWFHRALTLLMILRHLTNKDPQGLAVTNDAITDACQALVGPTAHSRLLVISGIPTHLEEHVVRSAIRRACNSHGGVFKDEIFIPLQEEDPKKSKDKAEGGECKAELEKPSVISSAESLDVSSSSSVTPAVSMSASASTSHTSLCSSQGVSRTTSDISVDQFQVGQELVAPPGILEPHTVSSQESLDLSICSTGSLGSLGSIGEPLDSADTASVSDVGSMYTVTSLDSNALIARPIKGYAVVEVRARAKIEKIRASLFNSSDLIGLSSLAGEGELMEMSTEEILTVSTVNQSLFDTQGSPALEDYFTDKSIKGEKLVLGARDVLSDIFKSCIHSEQMLSLTPAKPIKVADIYLSKEQINSQTPGNLLHVFFTNIRPPKKVLEDQLTQILRKYGVPKPKFDKNKYSKAGKEQHPGKVVSTKRPICKPPTKEKSVLNSVRTALSEKKPIVKPKSPEKSKPDENPEKSPTKKQEVPEEKYLTLEGFHRFVVDRAKQDIRSVWRAILACGYDLHFERCSCIDNRHAQKACRKWALEMDVALVQYVNRLCRHLAITPARLHPHEVYLDSADTADPRVSCLLNIPIESLRLRFALLQSLNTTLETFFLPLVELRQTDMYEHSIAALLREAKGLIFYDTKVTVMNRVLNATVQRTADHAAPEITLDPLEIVGGEIRTSENTYFCQAARQLASVPSSQLCVKLASGGDPTYAFNIRFTGEEVHGTSGSFRHFLWQVCKELQSSALSLLLPCPSSAANRNKGKYILTPSPITYAEEQLLHFFGQLLGIAIRADVPLPLDLLSTFWKTLVGEPLDPDTDLQEVDILTYNYIKKFESVNDETELEALCAEVASQHLATESPDSPSKPCCKYTYMAMTGEEVELCSGGRNITVSWENKDAYAAAIRNLRLREMQNFDCMTAVRAGLGTIIPLQLLTTLTPLEMELRTCGLPYISLEFLKAHTMYQVGLMETDQHIEFFWAALEMFTQEELCKFIKFACNQERIPFTCPCKDGGPDTAHVPPYPMKIAPPDGAAGSADSRYIRVETCMFMIKLPQYSSLEIMLEKLRYAIHYREDPLSG
nr:PREDICTED: probable E3 ubiquitin-protein ligase HECTD4 [Latimeria chalumnae]|eukprot:XP_014344074.1 PREDICTED: probable E3 ubiquitin-protein ligase HECTD4 [Latimeria chalumnae]